MNEIRFEWNLIKERANIRKHGITFSEAETVFLDEEGILFDDPDHSVDEERFLFLGLSAETRLLIVCHCIRDGESIRIISARRATNMESRQYFKFQGR